MSSGEGTGIGIFDEAINLATNVSTFGTVGFGKDGFKAGVVGKPVLGLTKELTGAKAAEEANEITRQQIDQARQQATAERSRAIEQNKQRQIQLSKSAGRARKATQDRGSSTLGNSGSDLLGL